MTSRPRNYSTKVDIKLPTESALFCDLTTHKAMAQASMSKLVI